MKRIVFATMKWLFLILFVAAMVRGMLAVRELADRGLPQIETQKAELVS